MGASCVVGDVSLTAASLVTTFGGLGFLGFFGVVMLDITTPEEAQPPEVVPTEKVATKKPRKPRPPKIVAKLATVAEGSAETAPAAEPPVRVAGTTQEAQLPLEFWAGLIQTQKVIMARRKSERYNSFRIT